MTQMEPDAGHRFRKPVAFVLLAAMTVSLLGAPPAATPPAGATLMRGAALLALRPPIALAPPLGLASPLPVGTDAETGSPAPGAAGAGEPANPAALGVGAHLTASELHLLARIISAEARGEPYEGQVAVGAVVLNRVRDHRFPDSVAEVIYQPGQFEPVRNGQINLKPTESSARAAAEAAAGRDPTGGALYFWEPEKTWSPYLWSRPLKIIIGGHRFTG